MHLFSDLHKLYHASKADHKQFSKINKISKSSMRVSYYNKHLCGRERKLTH